MKKEMGIEGVGPKIMVPAAISLIIAYFLDKNYHSRFIIANDDGLIRTFAIIIFVIGLAMWLWTVVLLLVNFPKDKLITTGPYAIFLHPLYNSFSFFILPALALYLNSWIYLLAPIVLFLATQILGKNEEAYLSETFGSGYFSYRKNVWLKL